MTTSSSSVTSLLTAADQSREISTQLLVSVTEIWGLKTISFHDFWHTSPLPCSRVRPLLFSGRAITVSTVQNILGQSFFFLKGYKWPHQSSSEHKNEKFTRDWRIRIFSFNLVKDFLNTNMEIFYVVDGDCYQCKGCCLSVSNSRLVLSHNPPRLSSSFVNNFSSLILSNCFTL